MRIEFNGSLIEHLAYALDTTSNGMKAMRHVTETAYDDITKGLKVGANTLEIRITNEWTNRIAGDKSLPADQKILPSASGVRTMFRSANLPDSGLISPITLTTGDAT